MPRSPAGTFLLSLKVLEKVLPPKKVSRHGWEVVEKYISGQKGYEKGFGGRERREGSGERCGYEETGAMPVVVIVEEKEKALKIGYMTLHAKLFGASQK